MSTLKEVEKTIKEIKKYNSNIAITQCTSAYPCNSKISDIGAITQYQKFKLITGLSDHTNNIYTSIKAIALGAKIIEKHFTLDKTKGPDHASSLEPNELKSQLRAAIPSLMQVDLKKRYTNKKKKLLNGQEKVLFQPKILREMKLIKKYFVKRPAPNKNEIPADKFFLIINKKAKYNILKNTKIKWNQIK